MWYFSVVWYLLVSEESREDTAAETEGGVTERTGPGQGVRAGETVDSPASPGEQAGQ